MNLRKKTENSGEKVLTYYGDSLTLFGEMVEVSHRQTPRKDCDAKAPRQDSTISGFRLGIAAPNDRAAASQGREAAVSVCPEGKMDCHDNLNEEHVPEMRGWSPEKHRAQGNKTRATYARRRLERSLGVADVDGAVVTIRQQIVDVGRLLHERIEMLKNDERLFESILIAAMALDIPPTELPYDDYRSMVDDASGCEDER